jgi:hypothetical protein
VTFEVPMNLTRMAPDITKVMVTCTITSDAIKPTLTSKGMPTGPRQLATQAEFPVSTGRLVTTARVVVSVSSDKLEAGDPTGKAANYECTVLGFSSNPKGEGWNSFADNQPNSSFRLAPTPSPIKGSLIW